ncbi:DUF4158 domain-containing protein [Streptomyces sp. NPDC006393]|uniref:DUF4158 domain-containing protein n=1 Tax=Streptomyces sp. NPDC006393 TaxID=3156763 RepID=UPI0033F87F6F
MGQRPVGMDELVEQRTVLDDEVELVAGKRGGTRLGFALLLKFYTRYGRFPRSRADFPDEVVEFVARQMQVPAAEFASYALCDSTVEYHRARQHPDAPGRPRRARLVQPARPGRTPGPDSSVLVPRAPYGEVRLDLSFRLVVGPPEATR